MDFEGLKRLAAQKRDQAHETADAEYEKAISVIEALQGVAPRTEPKTAKPKTRAYQKRSWDNILPAIATMPSEFKARDVISAMGVKFTDAAYQAVNTRLNGLLASGNLELAQKRHRGQPHIYRRVAPGSNGVHAEPLPTTTPEPVAASA